MASTPTRRKRKRPLNEEEFMRLASEGRKLELVDGEAKEVPTGFRHDIITARLIARIGVSAEARGYVAGSQAGFRMADGNVRCPDVSFTLKERLPEGEPSDHFAPFAPDLAVEVVSPSEDYADLLRKVGEYFASGSKQVWLLFPNTRTVKVFTAPFEMQTLQAHDELTGGDLLPNFRVRVGELFEV